MTSLLRQIVAGPRAKHAETGLDLCYVTSNIIATSGPSQTYPQRAYRNPLDRLVAFLDAKHGDNWAIWEFRGEGTGYPDEAVYGRIRHYPWPDHHPPPFRLVPVIMASMRNWIAGGDSEGGGGAAELAEGKKDEVGENGRVVVVHCKAGKGRSGSMATSYLVSECGWTVEDALARFTERRMRPKFGAGVSIPSQLRWIGYVDRWTKGGKKYVDREVEIVEMHVWGLRHGVKVSIEGFIEEGKKIRVLHTFKADERFVVEGDAPGGDGVRDFVADVAGGFLGPESEDEEIVEEPETAKLSEDAGTSDTGSDSRSSSPARSKSKKPKSSRTTGILRSLSKRRSSSKPGPTKSQTIDPSDPAKAGPTSPPPALASTLLSPDPSKTQSQSRLQRPATFAATDEPGGQAVLFKPASPIRVPTGDVNVVVERRNRAPASMGLTMVTAVAHVWFNCFFEGRGPEQDGKAEDSGVFEIEWDAMDGIKGSSQKGTRAADRIAVVWRVPGGPEGEEGAGTPRVEIHEPASGEAVPQMEAADWKGGNEEDPEGEKRLGLRKEDPDSAGVSKASSLKSVDVAAGPDESAGKEETDDESLAGVKATGPEGEVLDSATAASAPSAEVSTAKGKETGNKTAQNGFIIE